MREMNEGMLLIQSHCWIEWYEGEREKGGRDWFWGLRREMIVLRERLSVLFMKWEWTHGWFVVEEMDCLWFVW